jgi:hypothetical protein
MEISDKALNELTRLYKEDPKHARIEGEPVLLFDNKSNDTHLNIELLSIPETADLLKIFAIGVRRLQQRRHVLFVKLGGCVRFFKSDLMAYLEKRWVESID